MGQGTVGHCCAPYRPSIVHSKILTEGIVHHRQQSITEIQQYNDYSLAIYKQQFSFCLLLEAFCPTKPLLMKATSIARDVLCEIFCQATSYLVCRENSLTSHLMKSSSSLQCWHTGPAPISGLHRPQWPASSIIAGVGFSHWEASSLRRLTTSLLALCTFSTALMQLLQQQIRHNLGSGNPGICAALQCWGDQKHSAL